MGVSGNNVVGYYQDGSGTHGFLYNGSTYTTIAPPGFTFSQATAVSGNNVVGFYNTGSAEVGFLYDGSTYTTLDFSGPSYIVALGVSGNNVVGYYHENGTDYGFLYQPDGSGGPSAAPAPPSVVLLGIGFVGMLACRWRRRKAA